MNKCEYIINELMVPAFITVENQEILLKETEDTGKSELKVNLLSKDNLCISNVDKKKTDFHFFQSAKEKSMYKRVDHMIFERQQDNDWKLYLIEMKGSVGERKWDEIKGKFRASYLIAQSIAGMLELRISETIMCTTFEKVQFAPSSTMPASRRQRSGMPLIRMEDEWNGMRFGLNFGERIPFIHIPVQMKRDETGILIGNLAEE